MIIKQKNITNEEVKRKTNLPTRHLTTALLGEDVARNWIANFSTLQAGSSNANDLLTEAILLKNLANRNKDNFLNKKINTSSLTALNQEINKSVIALKRHIKAQYEGTEDLATLYASYGMEVSKNLNYYVVSDNTRRQQVLDIIVSRLSERGNPFVNLKHGLDYWRNVRTEHSRLWAASNQLRSDTSNTASQIERTMTKVTRYLQQVRKSLDIEYTGLELKRQKRVMGFLKESI
jgi:hypothetical protein